MLRETCLSSSLLAFLVPGNKDTPKLRDVKFPETALLTTVV